MAVHFHHNSLKHPDGSNLMLELLQKDLLPVRDLTILFYHARYIGRRHVAQSMAANNPDIPRAFPEIPENSTDYYILFS